MRATVSPSFARHATRFASAQWAMMGRSPLERLALIVIGGLVLALAVAVVLVVAVVAIPVGLVLLGAGWVRSRVSRLLPQRRHDGRRNVRVRPCGSSVGVDAR